MKAHIKFTKKGDKIFYVGLFTNFDLNIKLVTINNIKIFPYSHLGLDRKTFYSIAGIIELDKFTYPADIKIFDNNFTLIDVHYTTFFE